MKVLKMFFWPVILIVAVFGVVAAYLYFNQHKMVFFPSSDIVITPSDLNLNFEDHFLNVTDSDSIHAWFLPNRNDSSSNRVLLFCHGNAGNMSHRMETAEFIIRQGYSIVMFDYRGYGRSSGIPTEDNLHDDAQAVYDWLLNSKQVSAEDIIIFGRSLGGAVAVDLASRNECGGLIVESSFTSIEDMGRRMFPYMPVKLLIRFDFNALEKISRINCPVLVTHSPTDEIIAFELGRKLFDHAPDPKQFYELSGGHNDRFYFEDSGYVAAIRDLIDGAR